MIKKIFLNITVFQSIALGIATSHPFFAFAAETPKTISEIFYSFAVGNLAGFIPTLVMVAFVTMLVGVVRYMRAGDNQEKRAQGRMVMIYGITVLFVMTTMWGFVSIIRNSFFHGENEIPNYLPNLL